MAQSGQEWLTAQIVARIINGPREDQLAKPMFVLLSPHVLPAQDSSRERLASTSPFVV